MLLVKRLGPSSGDKRYINAIAIAIGKRHRNSESSQVTYYCNISSTQVLLPSPIYLELDAKNH